MISDIHNLSLICRKQKRSKNENPSSSSLLCVNHLRNPLHRITIVASTIATTVAVVGHCHRRRRPRLCRLSPSSTSHADAINTAGGSAAALLLRRRCLPLSPPLLASSATPPLVSSSSTPRIIVANTIATIVDAVIGHCYQTTLGLSLPPLSAPSLRSLSPSATPPAARAPTPSA
ncbi:hypothetical protein Scep_017049 [Stephania cephalantha]|uniref:Uncharacterized protein n=1 Tax=Stephania cephalantha TaxID=152367 RepID=A0AAP0INU8_9MAGN